MLVENVSLWCKRLSKKVKIQNKKRHKETQTEEKKGHRRPPVTLTFPVFSSTEDVPVSTSVSLHVHKQKYIHSSHFGTFFFFFFVHKNYKKLQKAPLNRPVVTLAAVQLANPPEPVTSTKRLSHISLLSTGASYIALHTTPRWYPPGLKNNEHWLLRLHSNYLDAF